MKSSRTVISVLTLSFGGSLTAQDWPKVELTEFKSGFMSPIHIANAGDGTNRLFIVDYFGGDSLSFTASDGTNISNVATVTISVTPVKRRPPAEERHGDDQEKQPVTIAVLSNDTDPDNDPFTVVNVSTPFQGTAAIVSNAIRYTPAKNATGNVTFTYGVIDGKGGSASASVTVSVSAK